MEDLTIHWQDVEGYCGMADSQDRLHYLRQRAADGLPSDDAERIGIVVDLYYRLYTFPRVYPLFPYRTLGGGYPLFSSNPSCLSIK